MVGQRICEQLQLSLVNLHGASPATAPSGSGAHNRMSTRTHAIFSGCSGLAAHSMLWAA